MGVTLGTVLAAFGVAAGCTSFGDEAAPGAPTGPEAGAPDVPVLPGENVNIESVSVAEKTVTLPQGREVTINVTIVRGRFQDKVDISLKNLAKDFTSAPVVIPPGKSTVEIKLAAAGTVPLGTGQPVRILAQAGVSSKDVEVPLLVVGAPGSLDLSYGDKGVYRGPEEDAEQVYDAALLPDDSVIVAGRDKLGMFLRKITKDGKTDTGYGTGGKFQPTYNVFGTTVYMYEPMAIAALPDGRLLIADRQYGAPSIQSTIAIVSADGKQRTNASLPSANFAQIHNILPMGDGKFAVVGARRAPTTEIGDGRGGGFIATLIDSPSGAIDTTWGGATRYPLTSWAPAAPGEIQGSWITVDTEAGVGYSLIRTASSDWLIGDSAAQLRKDVSLGIARLGFNGKFNDSYGNGGINYWPTEAFFLGVVPLAGDSFMVAGIRRDAFVLAKFDAGMLDPAFNIKAVPLPFVTPVLSSESRNAANRNRGFVRDGAGYLLAATSYNSKGTPPGSYSTVVRATSDGVVDLSFGEAGAAHFAIGVSDDTRPVTSKILVQKTGRLLLVGTRDERAGGGFVAALWPAYDKR